MQFTNALPCIWTRNILEDRGNCSNLCGCDNHLTKNSHVFAVKKLNSKELHITLHYNIT